MRHRGLEFFMFAIVLLTTVYTDLAAADNVDIFCDSGALNANNQLCMKGDWLPYTCDVRSYELLMDVFI